MTATAFVTKGDDTLVYKNRWILDGKLQNRKIAIKLKQSEDATLHKIADRLLGCCNVIDGTITSKGIKHQLYRCNASQCVICKVYRNKKQIRRTLKAIERLQLSKNKDFELVALTLTVPNVHHTELKTTFQRMRKAVTKITRQKNWTVSGMVMSEEYTVGSDGSLHPHIHMLVLAEKHFFTKHFNLIDRWKAVMQLRHDPRVNIRTLDAKNPADIESAVNYLFKGSQLPTHTELTQSITKQLVGRRTIGSRGVLKNPVEPKVLTNPKTNYLLEDNEFRMVWSWRLNQYEIHTQPKMQI